jgi:glutaredoxin
MVNIPQAANDSSFLEAQATEHHHHHDSSCGHDHSPQTRVPPKVETLSRPDQTKSTENQSKGIISVIVETVGNILRGLAKAIGLLKDDAGSKAPATNKKPAEVVDIKTAAEAKSRAELRPKLSSIYHFPKGTKLQNPLMIRVKKDCSYCAELKDFLDAKGVVYELLTYDETKDPKQNQLDFMTRLSSTHKIPTSELLEKLDDKKTFPQVFLIDKKSQKVSFLGGCEEIKSLEDQGKLDELLLNRVSQEISERLFLHVFTLDKKPCQELVNRITEVSAAYKLPLIPETLQAGFAPFLERPIDSSEGPNHRNLERLAELYGSRDKTQVPALVLDGKIISQEEFFGQKAASTA